MISLIDKVLDESNCGANLFARAIDRGEEACECVDKPTNVNVVGRIHVKAARLRTETSKTNALRRCPAGLVRRRRVSTTSRSRSQIANLVNDELVQRNITLLSGETCRHGMRVVAAFECATGNSGVVLGNEGENSFGSEYLCAKRSGTLAVAKATGTCPRQSPVASG